MKATELEVMKATELGKAVAMVEYLNKCVRHGFYRFNRIASDRWALVKVVNGKTKTIATGRDIYEALYSWNK